MKVSYTHGVLYLSMIGYGEIHRGSFDNATLHTVLSLASSNLAGLRFDRFVLEALENADDYSRLRDAIVSWPLDDYGRAVVPAGGVEGLLKLVKIGT